MASESMDLIGDLATLLQNQFNGGRIQMKYNMNTGKKPFIHQHSLCFRHNYVAAHCCSNTEEDNEKKNIDVLPTHSICTKLPAMN
jgi:hypothetical protein